MTSQNLSASAAPPYNDYPANPREEGLKGGKRALPVDQHAADHAPQVSIVAIVKDGSRTLPRAIESVLIQDFAGIKYVIVDGGLKDGTLDILQSHQNLIRPWISEPDKGISDAFNRGIALSRGKFVGLLNSDDWYARGAIRAVVAEMRRTGADIACGRLQYWNGDSRTYLVDSDSAQLEREMTIGHPTVFVRRECYRKYGLFRLDFQLAMDYEWLLRANTAGASFVVIFRCLASMQGGGVGDRRWRNSQREVARARALHVHGADNAFAYNAYVVRRIVMGCVRRLLDASARSAQYGVQTTAGFRPSK